MMLGKTLALSALFTVLAASAALAVDEGNTKPKTNSAYVGYTLSADVINQTSVSGNIKGISCRFSTSSTSGSVVFTVNGGTDQTVNLSSVDYPTDSTGAFYTGWIPMNIRFSSSIRVQVQHTHDGGEFGCVVSWALD